MPGQTPFLFTPQLGWNAAQLPAGMENWGGRSHNSSHFSEFHDSGAKYTQINSFVAKAIVAYCKGPASNYALVRIGQGAYAVEHEKSDGSVILFKLDATGRCKGTIQEVSGRLSQIPTLDKNTTLDCTSMMLCLLMRTCDVSQTVKNRLDGAAQRYATSGDYEEADIYYISDAVYYAHKSNQVKCTTTGGNIDMLSQSQITSGTQIIF